MGKYELVVIIDATLSQADKDETMKKVAEAIDKCNGKVLDTQVWIEKQKMSFLMKKCPEGTYYLVAFEGAKENLPDLRRALKLNDNVLRSLIVKAGK